MNVIYISIYDLESKVASGFTSIGVFRSETKNGAFVEITNESTRMPLSYTSYKAEDTYYTYTDTTETSYWYKYKLFDDDGIPSSEFETINPFRANTSDLTEDLRYQIEDIDKEYRYSMKELRRFIKLACQKLQSTPYIRRFKADYDGIISPAIQTMDKGIILLQAQIEVIDSQRLKAADTNISMSDGRGRFNNRTSEALRADKKELKDERDSLIANYNKIIGADVARVVR